MVIIDTDFLSSFFKINRLKLILKSLNIQNLIIPSTVYGELKDSHFFEDISHLFVFKEKDLTKESYILVKNVNLTNLAEYFNDKKVNVLGK